MITTALYFQLFIVLVVIDRFIARQARERAGRRVTQALRRISGDLKTLATFVLWDYAEMHGASYQRPPNDLRGLLNHWKAGVATRDQPWPESPNFLVATETLAKRLVEQIGRHDRVLEDDFVAVGYEFARSERMGRNMYLDNPEDHDDDWKATALSSLTDDVLRLLEVFEPYARRDLRRDWAVTLRDDEIDYTERRRRRLDD